MKKVPVPMEMDSSGFYQEVSQYQNVNFDGNQHNGMHGSPLGHGIGKKSETAEIGVDYVMSQPDDKNDSIWEKKMSVSGNIKDINDNHAHEVDLSKHIPCVGCPDESINGNSSTDCYGT